MQWRRQRGARLVLKTAWCKSLGHHSFRGRVSKLRPRVKTWSSRSVARPLRRSSKTLQRLSQRLRTTENCWLTEATRAKKFHIWWIEQLFQAWNDKDTSFRGHLLVFVWLDLRSHTVTALRVLWQLRLKEVLESHFGIRILDGSARSRA